MKYVIWIPRSDYDSKPILAHRVRNVTRFGSININIRYGSTFNRQYNGYWLSKEAYKKIHQIIMDKGKIDRLMVDSIRKSYPYTL